MGLLPMSELSRREGQIMEVLYRRGQLSVEEIREELPDAPSGSSVRKLLEILRDMGQVQRRYEGPRHLYFPAASPEEARASVLRQVVRTFFGGSRDSAVSALLQLDGAPPSAEELERVLEAVRRAEDENAEGER